MDGYITAHPSSVVIVLLDVIEDEFYPHGTMEQDLNPLFRPYPRVSHTSPLHILT